MFSRVRLFSGALCAAFDFEGWVTEFFNQIIIKSATFQVINRCLRLEGQDVQAIPDENRAHNMIPLNATDPALTDSNSGDLLGIAMKLLHRPAQVDDVAHNLRQR